MREITASPENCPLCPWHTSSEELIGWDCQFGTINQAAPWRVEFCSRHVVLPAKMNYMIWLLSGGHKTNQAD